MASQMDLKSTARSHHQSRGDPCRSTMTIHRWLHQPSRQQIRSRNHLRGRLHQQLTARQVFAVNADQITPYVADQTFRLKLSHALYSFKYSPIFVYRHNVSPNCFLHICSPNDFSNPRTVALMLGRLQRQSCLRLLPTRARASALCVMSGR